MPEMPLAEVERVFAMVMDTFKMGHHRSVVDAVDALVLLHRPLWLRMLNDAQKGGLEKMLAATCSCPYCSGAAAEVQVEFSDMVARHRRNMHHTMLAQLFFSDVRMHRTDSEIEELMAELEVRDKESDGEECEELASIVWDVQRPLPGPCNFL